MTLSVSQERMQWVDAMRGFSMIVVVLGHVLLSMGIGGYDSFLSTIFLTFRMPLFFFVSGYFSYRLLNWWTKDRLKDILKRKFQAQILCTVLFLAVYQTVKSGGVNFSHGFGGYWFTIVLFQMYLIYLLASYVSRLFKRDIVVPILIIISLFGILLLVRYNRSAWIWEFLCWENLSKYMQFFTLGIICSKYRIQFMRLLQNNIFITTAIIGWIICMILWYDKDFQNYSFYAYSFVHDILVRYFALASIVVLFFSNKTYFDGSSKLSKSLCFIGRRTLDIYMIHYFLLPDLGFMKHWIEGNSMLVIQLCFALSLTMVIVGLSITISSILRKSTTIECWLFGVKKKVVA